MQPPPSDRPHWTARRGFIAAAGFGGVGLYGMWAAYGAAPGPLALLGLGHAHGDGDVHGAAIAQGAGHAAAPGHAGHGAAPDDAGAQDFRALTDAFIERYRIDGGVVHPRRLGAIAGGGHARDAHDAHAGHGAQARPEAPADGPLEVPMVAGRWYYLPAALRLDAGEDYRLRLMTMDVSHGASIQFGRGARMLRLRPGRVTELDLRFHRPGRHLVTCTVYCGAAHDVMQATIEVV